MVARGARQLVGAHRVLYAAQAVAIVGIRQVVDGAELGGQRAGGMLSEAAPLQDQRVAVHVVVHPAQGAVLQLGTPAPNRTAGPARAGHVIALAQAVGPVV